MHAHIDQHQRRLYEEAVQLSDRIGIQPSQPRTVQHQVYRDNNPSSSEIYYQVNLTEVFLAHALQQLESRLSDDSYLSLKGFFPVPAVF